MITLDYQLGVIELQDNSNDRSHNCMTLWNVCCWKERIPHRSSESSGRILLAFESLAKCIRITALAQVAANVKSWHTHSDRAYSYWGIDLSQPKVACSASSGTVPFTEGIAVPDMI